MEDTAAVDREEIRYLGDLQRLKLQPGDRFVLSCEKPMSTDMATRIREQWHGFMGPDVPLLILSDGLKLGAIRVGRDAG